MLLATFSAVEVRMSLQVLKADNLHKSFYSPHRLEVLKGISLCVHRGESIAIMGKSGEGKSTLLHLLGTLEKPCAGKISILQEEIDYSRAAQLRNEKIGFIFQSFHLLEEETLLENVLIPAKIARQKNQLTYERALFLLERVGLIDRRQFLVKHLSGGEKQRASLARALLNRPALILADEPTGNLDQSHSAQIFELLLQLVKEEQKALIVATHDRELAAWCDRTLILKNGRID
jgi:lipoprotein-releasing system ATP-binding protein